MDLIGFNGIFNQQSLSHTVTDVWLTRSCLAPHLVGNGGQTLTGQWSWDAPFCCKIGWPGIAMSWLWGMSTKHDRWVHRERMLLSIHSECISCYLGENLHICVLQKTIWRVRHQQVVTLKIYHDLPTFGGWYIYLASNLQRQFYQGKKNQHETQLN